MRPQPTAGVEDTDTALGANGLKGRQGKEKADCTNSQGD